MKHLLLIPYVRCFHRSPK